LSHGLKRAQECNQCLEIVLRHPGIRTVRHERQGSAAIAGHSFGYSISNLLVSPAAEPRLFVHGEVGAVDGTERNGKGSSARVRCPLRVAVASATGRERKNVLSFSD